MSLRDMTEALYPEAVGRRRAEEVRALATSELRQLVPVERPSDSQQAWCRFVVLQSCPCLDNILCV